MEQNKKVKVIIPQFVSYQREDKELQKEQNRILMWNTKLAIWATIFAALAFMAQCFEVLVSAIK